MASSADDDLQASTTEGFKVGEKKTVEEYAKLGEWSNVSIVWEPYCGDLLVQPFYFPSFFDSAKILCLGIEAIPSGVIFDLQGRDHFSATQRIARCV